MFTQNYSILRGDSWNSRKYMFINEPIPDHITEEEILKGVEDGTYTYVDLRKFDIQADVKVNGELWFTLTDYMIVSSGGRYLHFTMTPGQSQGIAANVSNSPRATNSGLLEWGSAEPTPFKEGDYQLPRVGNFDIQFCEKDTGRTKTIWRGNFTLNPDVTERDPCGGNNDND
ncbi:conserved hypothetical protein [Vibrio chagasii]|nr:conserved hypothetical protein [Vibrio chagasii]